MSSFDKIRGKYPDDEVRNRVSSFLCSRHFPAFRALDVQVDQGTVTLSGQVRSYYEKQVAITSCQHVAGVVSLIDRIEVADPTREEPVRQIRKFKSTTLAND